jgi:cytochrome c oxidase cbb3-type subunit III
MLFRTRLRFIVSGLAAVLLLGVLLAWMQSPGHAQSPQQLEEGALLYRENCAVCHGPNGEGRVGATLAKDWPSIRPSATIRAIIERGIPGSVMPAWGEQHGGPLSSSQVDSLVAFILSWQTGGAWDESIYPTQTARPPITPAPNVEGDPNHGALLFGENCAVCHGPNGEGRVGATLAKNWSGIRPDLLIKTTVQRGIPGSVMPAWDKAYGGPLEESEINDIVAFVLSISGGSVVQVSPAVDPAPSPVSVPWLRGVGGVILFAVLLITIIGGALWLQGRR